MSELLANGHPVLAGTLRLPRTGLWLADLVVDTPEVLAGAVDLTSPDGTFALRGAVQRAGAPHSRCACRVVGGAGGLATTLAPRFYRDVPLRQPLGDILRECGETLAPGVSAALLDTHLRAWSRRGMPGWAALAALLEAAGAAWRALPDGTLHVTAAEAWPEARASHPVTDESPTADWLELAPTEPDPALLPGTTLVLDGESRGRVSRVEYDLAGDRTRARVQFEAGATTQDRTRAAFERAVRRALPRLDYLALYSARVVAQAADGSLDVQPDDARLPGMTGVPMRLFVPGATVRVGGGARVLVGFEQGDPARPVAHLWESGALARLRVDASERIELAGTKGVVREGDKLDLGEWRVRADNSTVPGTGIIRLAWIPGGTMLGAGVAPKFWMIQLASASPVAVTVVEDETAVWVEEPDSKFAQKGSAETFSQKVQAG